MKSIEERLEDVALGLSVPVDLLKRVFYHMESKGKVNADDIRFMQDLGLNVIKEIAELKFRSSDYITLIASFGKLQYEDAVLMIEKLTNEGGMFFNLKEKQSQTSATQLEKSLKAVIIEAYNAGYQECENKGMREYSAEQYYRDHFNN